MSVPERARRPRVLVIDNYDSFTYNLVQYLEMAGASCDVFFHDAVDVAAIAARAPDGVLVSPGPASPAEAGISLEAVRALAGKIPVLGVCLGHQVIGQVFGGTIGRAREPRHGRVSPIHHDGTGIFAGLPSPFEATRYHSLIVERASLPSCLVVSAWTEEGEIMGLRHTSLPIEGVQFHPESIATTHGLALLTTWLRGLPVRA